MAPSETPADGQRPRRPEGAPSYRPWAKLLGRTFAVDILACPKCHGRMRLLRDYRARWRPATMKTWAIRCPVRRRPAAAALEGPSGQLAAARWAASRAFRERRLTGSTFLTGGSRPTSHAEPKAAGRISRTRPG